MHESKFRETIAAIPGPKWETTLPIGAFRELQVLTVMERFFSFIARCKVLGDSGSKIVFIKMFRNLKNRSAEVLQKKFNKDYEASQFWYGRFANCERFAVVKPVFSIPEQLISVTEETPGKSLYQLVLQNARWIPAVEKMRQLKNHFHQTGEWLKYKQSILTIENETYSIDELADYLEVRFNILLEEPRRRFPKEYRDKVLDYITANQPAITKNELAVTTNHSDFNPGNILVDGKKVTVLDFGRLVTGSYLLDVSKLYFQLHLLTFKPQFRKSVICELQSSLLEGFGNRHANELTMFRFLTIRNIITHLTNITHFWRYGVAERMYNAYAMRQELKLLDTVLMKKGG